MNAGYAVLDKDDTQEVPLQGWIWFAPKFIAERGEAGRGKFQEIASVHPEQFTAVLKTFTTAARGWPIFRPPDERAGQRAPARQDARGP